MRLIGLVVAVPLLAGCGLTSVSSGASSCVGPFLDDQPSGAMQPAPAPHVEPGEDLTVYGHGYAESCNDTSLQVGRAQPLPPVQVTLRLSDGRRVALGSFSPGGDDLGFTVPVHVPRSASPGTALVADDLHHAYRFSIAGAASR